MRILDLKKMAMNIREIVRRILLTGTKPEDDIDTIQVYRQTNAIAFVYIFLNLSGIFSTYFFNRSQSFFLHIALIPFVPISFILTYYGRVKSAQIFIIYLVEIQFLLMAILLTNSSLEEPFYLMFCFITYPLIASLLCQPVFLHAVIAIIQTIILYSYLLQFHHLVDHITLNPIYLALTFYHIILFISIVIYILNKENQKTKTRLRNEIKSRKDTQESLLDYSDKLKKSNQELEQFAFIVSHDLQEPLRMVSSYIKLIEIRYKGKLDKEGHEFIDFAVDGAKRMQVLIKDLLAYSRVAEEGKSFDLTECRAVYEKTTKNLEISIKEHEAKVTCDVLPQVLADESQLVQLFQNLIGNALKFCKDRLPEIHVSAEKEGKFWKFGIHDNGIGIASEYQERVFQVFERLHSTENYKGTGIGLATCKKIVERNGGKIWFDSKVGKGTTFWFTIPVIAENEKQRLT
ncbi:MAG: ATP-binding protein [Chitinispirillia bacterium]|jgi:signal transduction histidine kinase